MHMAGMKDIFDFVPPQWPPEPVRSDGWLSALRRYLATTIVLNLFWESVQLPLYTIWQEGTFREKALAVLHCTAGDLIIALSILVCGLVTAGDPTWPGRRRGRIAALTLVGGLAYTVFSEWFNIEVRRSWAYSNLMPTLPPLGTGLSPILQWLVVPTLALWAAHCAGLKRRR